jgi:hypothetical protein
MVDSSDARIEIRDQLSDDEEVELIQIMNRHSDQVSEERSRSLLGAAAMVGMAIKFVIEHQEDIKNALELAEDLIGFLKKWRSKKTAEGQAKAPAAVPAAAQAPATAEAPAQAPLPSGLIVVVGPDQVPFDLTWASDEKIRQYFSQRPTAP